MNNLRFIVDIHLSPVMIADLQANGYDIVRITDLLLPTTSDKEILALAQQENRIILTQDLDFSMLVALGKYEQPSLITLRLLSAQLKIYPRSLCEHK